MKDSKQIALAAYKALDDKKAEHIKILDIRHISVLADYFVIANGSNAPHMDALVDNVAEELAKEKISGRVEGVKNSGWVLMDYDDVIIHIFSREDRAFYDLERIWRDGILVDPVTE